MTDAEIITVKARISEMFPSVKHWAKQLDGVNELGLPVPRRPGDIREAMAKRWALALQGVELQDALKAIDALAVEPVDPWPYHGDKERVGAIVAAKARSFASERAEQRRTTSEPTGRRSVSNAGLGIMARLAKEVAEHPGHSSQCQEHRQTKGRCHPDCQVTAEVAARIAAEDVGLAADAARYHCSSCRDTGQVMVLDPAAVVAIAQGADPSQFTRGTTCRCTCDAGERRKRGMAKGDSWAAFDPQLHVNMLRPRAMLILDCKAVAEMWQRMTVKRVSSFDQFNDAKNVA